MVHTVLFVDDEPAVTAALKLRLRAEPFRILQAASATEALQILSQEPVDIVVSDESMPGVSGSELITHIFRTYPDTICMILTGRPSVDAAIRAINDGRVYRILTKPCDSAGLAIIIHQALREKALLVENRRLARELETQADRIRQLEVAHPGIMHVVRDEDDAVVID
jgi:two-component system, probable response regulator PhcQ